ncbi:MAG: PEP-CTERM sorting domain-containing protein [Verrucomicrobiales bacterium]|nr:PEP-CTERM sorting domain-containing protein [Verrucomicrobiales bacterium]
MISKISSQRTRCKSWLLGGLFCAVACVAQSQAAGVTWSSQYQDRLFDSGGGVLDTQFSFEVGIFLPGFTPTASNVDLWESNWRTLDRAYDPTPEDPNDGDPEGWNVPEQFFVGYYQIEAGGYSSSPDADPLYAFPGGAQAYLWVYDSKSLDAPREWALLTDGITADNLADAWVVPDADAGSLEWYLEDLDVVIYGGGNDLQGPGGYTLDPVVFSLQTHSVAVPVPEPGSALLVGLTLGLAALLRRRGLSAARG